MLGLFEAAMLADARAESLPLGPSEATGVISEAFLNPAAAEAGPSVFLIFAVDFLVSPCAHTHVVVVQCPSRWAGRTELLDHPYSSPKAHKRSTFQTALELVLQLHRYEAAVAQQCLAADSTYVSEAAPSSLCCKTEEGAGVHRRHGQPVQVQWPASALQAVVAAAAAPARAAGEVLALQTGLNRCQRRITPDSLVAR